ncbi:tRNA intron endonuclease catalytic domain [Echinococcus multilocularis]|uniref:tRNA intron endonuclease catalytic domain n=1 Tax=Echinococcus multilocularis TaxID=6211 RepID=A0A068Y9S1_ECHMU|nr:tRNA intron endonuclease catalytic domain [Echinococcus multilocularis]
MTLYMAIDGRSSTRNSRSEWLATPHTSAVASTGSAMPSAGDSLSSLVGGLAPRPFGSVTGGVIYQPNLINCCDKLRPPNFPTLTTDNTIWSHEIVPIWVKRLCFTGKFLFNEPVEEEQRGAFLVRRRATRHLASHLWDPLSSSSNPSSGPALTPFHLRYAAYLYYRSREQIVPPFLTLDGVDFLLYIEPTRLRHAAYAVIVVPANGTRSACDVAVGPHVAPSVAMVMDVFKRQC